MSRSCHTEPPGESTALPLESRHPRPFVMRRVLIAVAGCAVVAAGLGSRYGLSGFWAKHLGVAFWCVELYICILFVRPQMGVCLATAIALAVSWAVEFSQLTTVPAWLSSKHLVLRWIFGTTFSVYDLPTCAVGVGFAAAVHLALAGRGFCRPSGA